MKISNIALVAALAVSGITASKATLTEEAAQAFMGIDVGEANAIAAVVPDGDIPGAIAGVSQALDGGAQDIDDAIDDLRDNLDGSTAANATTAVANIRGKVAAAPAAHLDAEVDALHAKVDAAAPAASVEASVDALLAIINAKDVGGFGASAGGAGVAANGGAFTTLQQFINYVNGL